MEAISDGGIFGWILALLALTWGFMLLALPVYVWLIHRHTKEMRDMLEQILFAIRRQDSSERERPTP